MTELILDTIIFLTALAAIFYGYNRWLKCKHKDELWWCVSGVVTLLAITWDYVSRHVLISNFDASLLFWSRQLAILPAMAITKL